MTTSNYGHPTTEMTTLDRSLVFDLCWLLGAVEDFCRYAPEDDAVAYLLDYANDELSPADLALMARKFLRRLTESLEQAS